MIAFLYRTSYYLLIAPPANQNGQTNGQNKPNGSSFYGNNAAPSRAVNNIPKQAPRTPGGSVQRIHSIESLSPYQNRYICSLQCVPTIYLQASSILSQILNN